MRQSRWAILWAVVLIIGGGLLLAQNLGLFGKFEAPIWSFIFGGVGALFLLDVISTRGNDWWALIPGCVSLGIAATIYLAERHIPDEWAGSAMLFSIGLPFLLIYAIKRGEFWWALIPGGIMTAIAVIPILTLGVPGEVIGTFVLWVIAIPFWVVYLVNRKNWWAIIPAGTLTVIGLMPLLALSKAPGQLVAGVFFIGLAAVFGLIYLLHLREPEMVWAVYPAAVLFAIGIGVTAFGQNWWPLVLIGLGVVLLIRAVWPRPR